MSRRLHSLSAGAIALALLTTPEINEADCSNAADRYTAAVAQIEDAVRSYEKCVASSNGRNDCAQEMLALDNAHDKFADAVADRQACP